MGKSNLELTKEMLVRYEALNERKKEIEKELDSYKKQFHEYFDRVVGKRKKGEAMIEGYKIQRQIRIAERYKQEETVKMLEELNLTELIKKIPDEGKIKSALDLGLIKLEELEECKTETISQAIIVKQDVK